MRWVAARSGVFEGRSVGDGRGVFVGVAVIVAAGQEYLLLQAWV